jgi:hypothetical protein
MIMYRLYRGWGVRLATHLRLATRLRMSGFIPLLPLYVFVVHCLQ